MKKISVIVPVYNQEKYLDQCVDSILSSTITDFECILVDDGSKDSGSKICDEWAQRDERVYVILKENGGLTSARKAGFAVAQGEYICFVDSDDYIKKEMLEKLLYTLEEHQADVSVCGHFQDKNGVIEEDNFTFYDKIVEKKDMIRKYVLPIVGKIYATGYINYPGYVWGRLYRKSIIGEECFVSEREVLKSMKIKFLRPRQIVFFYLFKLKCYDALYVFQNFLFA